VLSARGKLLASELATALLGAQPRGLLGGEGGEGSGEGEGGGGGGEGRAGRSERERERLRAALEPARYCVL
jgi:hypothetical protein